MDEKITNLNECKTREELIDEMMKNDELHVMTECAYGKAIGNDQVNNTLNNKSNQK